MIKFNKFIIMQKSFIINVLCVCLLRSLMAFVDIKSSAYFKVLRRVSSHNDECRNLQSSQTQKDLHLNEELSLNIIKQELIVALFSEQQASSIIAALPDIGKSRKGFYSRLSQFTFLVQEGVYNPQTAYNFACDQPNFFDWDLEVVYENDHYVAINKPFNVRLNNGSKRQKLWDNEVTVSDWLDDNYPEFQQHHLCHQLDMATSGILLIAKRHRAASKAQKLFQKRQVNKTYSALVYGHPSWDELIVNAPICRDPNDAFKMKVAEGSEQGKHSETHIQVLKKGHLCCNGNKQEKEEVSLVALYPKTGRRHQLRVHTLSTGHPIVGDATYSLDLTNYRMFLHAEALSLALPITVGGDLDIKRKSDFNRFVC
mmetsp:Transcript_30327/g.39995  ORF Transcript_30327/g.39995 Transcript_30327/m.39995 type:complete len:370 (-) Transcript_30327:351-1460(-)|eukprot:CAMPEP_0117843966 /NCGR_PEP_ID=MMETSP0949-20121206/17221_1 /TAXON_ID=44440 /ORGANISM="Chattonella subsalsa, Strain CCMP2191" /LENGTH=369 /DNA_ID=CAMNT_0005688899 /DNA_START=45 /DNA_END=1154 /DNA_ORIENTATION=-